MRVYLNRRARFLFVATQNIEFTSNDGQFSNSRLK